MIKYILASASPRRKELLAHLGISYQVCPSRCEEVITQTEPGRVVEELSYQKACDVAMNISREDTGKTVIIGADTVVAIEGRILGKPCSEAQAAEMLALLSGRTHEVYTGVTLAVITQGGMQTETFHECTKVQFVPMSEREIQDYIQTGEPMDKAGAYGIQGQCAKYIRSIEGDYFNVVGLPLCGLYQRMKEQKLLEEQEG